MKYLYLHLDVEPCESDTPPNEEETQLIIDGDLRVYKFEEGRFLTLEPIDSEDTDSWSFIETPKPTQDY